MKSQSPKSASRKSVKTLKSVGSDSHPALTALDLATLAARLDPIKSRHEPEAAFKQAFEFYIMACVYVEKTAPRDIAEILYEAIGTPLGEELQRQTEARELQREEKEALRFYPERQAGDDVREYLKVKTAKAVTQKLRKLFVDDEQNPVALRSQYKDFMERLKRTEKSGEIYWAIDKRILDLVKRLEHQIKRRGGKKSTTSTRGSPQSASKKKE